MSYRLTCHCGAVELEVDLPDGIGNPSRCDCSFCRRRGVMNIGVPLDSLRILRGAENLTLYQWGTNTAEHYFCRTCGIYTHHRRRSDPNSFGVNVAAIHRVDVRSFENVSWTDGINHPKDRKND